jgi:uncharacterized membrane protein
VSLYEFLLFAHVASAFAFVASYVVFTAALLVGRRLRNSLALLALLRIVGPANALAWIGATGTIVFGVWLAIDVDGYELWDGWIAAALVLWLVTEEGIRREDLVFRQARRAALNVPATDADAADGGAPLRSRQAALLHVVAGIGMAAILALMIFKPGA